MNTGHIYGSVTNMMMVLKMQRKGKYLNTLERYYIYKMRKDGLQMNDACIDNHNPIFEIVQEENSR
jgi:hypothetical protein